MVVGSYMEVAVMGQILSVRFIGQSILSLCLVLGLVGCADMMTYSQDAQREGETLYKKGDYANAAGAFRNSVRQNPQNYQGYYYLASSYEHLGQYQQSIAEYKTARKATARSFEGRYDDAMREKIVLGLASAVSKSDSSHVEIDQIQKEAQSNQSAEDWFLVAKVLDLRGDADSAIDAYNHAVALAPNDFLINKDFGLFLVRVGQGPQAQRPLERAYSVKQDDQQVNNALRQIGVVPGPSLKDETQLARPIIPKGPIPEVKVQNLLPGGNGNSGSTVSSVPRD